MKKLYLIFFILLLAIPCSAEYKQVYKIGICTDLHNADIDDYPAPYLTCYRDTLVNDPNKMDIWKSVMDEFEPDVIAQLGDIVNYAFSNEDNENPNTSYNTTRFSAIKTAFEDVTHGYALHVCGNHDYDAKDDAVNFKPDWLTATGLISTYYSVDYAGVHFVILDTGNNSDGTYNGEWTPTGDYLGTPQLAWLKEDLWETTKPVIVMGHCRLGSTNSGTSINDLAAFQTILSATDKVIGCFNGHEHVPKYDYTDPSWSRTTTGGINYFSLDALVSDAYPDASFSSITIDFANSNMVIDGNHDQPDYDFTFDADNFYYNPEGTDRAVSEDNTIPESPNDDVLKLINEQAIHYQATGKYMHHATENINGTFYRINEYVTPSSDAGFQIIENESPNEESYGIGNEATGRSI